MIYHLNAKCAGVKTDKIWHQSNMYSIYCDVHNNIEVSFRDTVTSPRKYGPYEYIIDYIRVNSIVIITKGNKHE